MKPLGVLIAEDDPMVVEIHRRCIGQVEGFHVVGSAGTGARALELLRSVPVDLMVLDIFMPDLDGLETLRGLREKGLETDVVVVSAATDVGTVHEVMRAGAFDYIVKPFRFERMHETLRAYRAMREKLKQQKPSQEYRQEEIDHIFRLKGLRPSSGSADLPKGLSLVTLEKITAFLKKAGEPLSAGEVARETGLSRVTVRRYLEYLVSTGKVVLQREYQDVGRPRNRYLFQFQ